MDPLSIFGFLSVSAGLLCYALEKRGPVYILLFAASCVLCSIYGFLQGAWPFGLIEIVWTITAFKRWLSVTASPPPA